MKCFFLSMIVCCQWMTNTKNTEREKFTVTCEDLFHSNFTSLSSSPPLLSVRNTTEPFLTSQLFAGCFTNYHYACTHLGHIHRRTRTHVPHSACLTTHSDSRVCLQARVSVHGLYRCVNLTVQPFKGSSNIYADVSVDPQASLSHMASTKKDGACVWRSADEGGEGWSGGWRSGGGPCVA